MTVLVLTASIEALTPNTHVEDPAFRASEYAEALRFYLDETPWPIRFVENSGYAVQKDPELAPLLQDERIELDQDPDQGKPERGKGYEEFRRLDEVVEKLHAEGFDRMIKVTGRYIVRNIRNLVPEREDRPYIDRHPSIKTGIALSSFFVCPIPYYRRWISGAYAQVDESEKRTIEKVLFERFEKAGPDGPFLLPWEPIFQGLSGTWGRPIGRNPYRRKLRNLYRSFLRVVGWKRILREF
jgi:hypothetical protein